MNTFLFLLGSAFIFLGWTFFYKPAWIVRFNRFARERVFNDALILLERRKKGILFLLVSFMFFSWGYYRAHYSPTRVMGKLVSTNRMLYQSFHHFHSGEYGESKKLCERVLERDPNNAEALYQLAAIYFLSGDHVNGDAILLRASTIPGQSMTAASLRKRALKLRGGAEAQRAAQRAAKAAAQ